MPAVRPLPLTEIRMLLEKHDYELIGQDRNNWAFASGPDDPPAIVPMRLICPSSDDLRQGGA